MRCFAGLLLVALAGLAGAGVPAVSAQTQAPCDGAPAPVLFLEHQSSLENLAFDGNGSLYLSDAGGARILRVWPDAEPKGELAVDAHGIVWGPDDRLYAAVTAGEDLYDIQRSTDSLVTAFEVYSTGLPVYNGMAFDAQGNLYATDDNIAPPEVPPDLVRIPRADPANWEPWTELYGPDGITFDAATGALYTVITADQSSPVLRLSPTDPTVSEVVTYLSYGSATLEPNAHPPQGDPANTVPKGLDDLTLGPDGKLYLAAHLAGELLRVDPVDGSACLVASGLEEPTSARFAHGFGPHGGKLFVTTWGGTGVTGLVQGNAGMHPPGKVWMFDFGFGEPPATTRPAVPPPGPSNATSSEDCALCHDLDLVEDEDSGKDSPSAGLGLALLAVACAVLLARRR